MVIRIVPANRSRRIGPLVLAALLLFGVGCVAEEPGEHRIVPKEQAPSPTAAAEGGTPEGEGALDPVERGRVLFTGKGICHACHGPDGSGTQIAPDLTDDEWLNLEEPITPEKLAALIINGVPDPVEHPGVMPPRGGAPLTDEEVEAIAAYVLALRH